MKDQIKTTGDSSLPPCGTYGSNYAIFRWTGDQWLMIQNCCSYGFHPQTPDDRGRYKGEFEVVTQCVPLHPKHD